MATMRIGILTGGGDCPGLNAVIRAVTRRALDRGDEVVGILHGWRGLIDGATRPLGARRHQRHPAPRRHHPAHLAHQPLQGRGRRRGRARTPGRDWTRWSRSAARTRSASPPACTPSTRRRSWASPRRSTTTSPATDYTFGFDTALSIATEAIDRLHSTAESHDRVMVCEVMGRHAGWIALLSGMAGGADVVLIPEQPVTVERCCELIDRRHRRGKDFSIVVVSEGWELRFEGGDGQLVAAPEADGFGHARLGGIGGAAGRRDRAPHGLRDPRHPARPRPARRVAHRARPRAGDPLRPARRPTSCSRARSA